MNSFPLHAYVAVIVARYRTLLQYRADAFAGLVTQLFWGAIRLMVLVAFFELAPDNQPMTLAQIAAYVWLGQALLAVFPWNVDTEIAEMIRSGSVAYELTRPLNLYWFWFARTIALRTAPTTLRCLPMVIFAMWVMPLMGLEKWALPPPTDWLAGISFVVSQLLGLLLACAMTMLMHVVLVWSLSGDGINRILRWSSRATFYPCLYILIGCSPFLNFSRFKASWMYHSESTRVTLLEPTFWLNWFSRSFGRVYLLPGAIGHWLK